MISFSIIMPVYNGEAYVETCFNSVLAQSGDGFNYEVLLVDDCSRDSTPALLSKLENAYPTLVKTFKTDKNSGPGLARNIGIENATGDWILFLDSDDQLNPDALKTLSAYILENKSKQLEIIGFNWRYHAGSSVVNGRKGGRYDFKSLLKAKPELLKDFISLGMDGSVIYTAIRSDLLKNNKIKFFPGVHEDIDFIFKVYWSAKAVGCVEASLYLKNNREGSIVNTISEKHIEGYFRAYREILDYIKSKGISLDEIGKAYYTGLIGVVATRAREINNRHLSENESNRLYGNLYDSWMDLSGMLGEIPRPELKTKYGMIAYQFFAVMENKKNGEGSPAVLIKNFMDDIVSKSWSCYDLHNSIFLAPDEVRTCCKRFFVDGKMKGDVAIVRAEKDDPSSISMETILKGKKDLYTDINRGECEACDGCPFLEFKDWGYIEDLNIEHVSFEYHSICNMKCTYCSETYYGGATPDYDVVGLIKQLFGNGSLDRCQSVIWGGGEPALEKNFETLVDLFAEKLPDIKQRILTNCVKYSEKVHSLLSENKATLLTSIDAGTKETFVLIRDSTRFEEVFKNLEKYAASNSKNVSIKYIFTDGNAMHNEVRSFVDLIIQHNLLDCSFQISSDFKHESIDMASAVSMIMLYGLLMKAGCRLVYFDELLRQRFLGGSDDTYKDFKRELELLGIGDTMADKDQFDKVVIWGAGLQTQLLLEKSNFFRQVKVDYIVDSTPSKINTQFMGYPVRAPETLLENDSPVLISAVQNSPLIYKKYIELGLQEPRLIKGLIL